MACLTWYDSPTYGFQKCMTFRIFGIEIETKNDKGLSNLGSFGIVLCTRIYDIGDFSNWFGKHPELSVGSIIACKICVANPEDISKEEEVNKMIQSKFIPKFYGHFVEKESKFIFLFMEYIEGANL